MRDTTIQLLAMAASLLIAPGVANGFPLDEEWVDVREGGRDLVDPAGDPAPDLIGAEGETGLAWYADSEDVQFRVRLADPSSLGTAAVGVMLTFDAAGTSMDALFVADGGAGEVAVYTPDGSEGLFPEWSRIAGDSSPDRTRTAGTFLDFAISRADAEATGWAPDAAGFAIVVAGPSVGAWTDILRCADLACEGGDLRSSALSVDSDLDGLTTPEELTLGLPPGDADADDDGIIDSLESFEADGDQDGIVDVRDCDSDSDGLPDGLEAGISVPSAGTNEANCFIADLDPGTTSSPAVSDTDGGGLIDGAEDVNRNGRVDDWETDPSSAADDADTDGDGIADVLEGRSEDGVVDDVDSDGDGISDAAEWLWDLDEDGVPAFLDDDSDGDGFSDALEGADDTDEDGWIDALDTDSDGDGRDDALEGGADIDCDGVDNRIDADDFDGYCDSAEVDPDFEDEEVSRPAGTLGGCGVVGAPTWFLFPVLVAIRRRR